MRTPLVKVFSLGMITGSFLTAGVVLLAAPADASPDDTSVAYASMYASAVCEVLDQYPTFDGIVGIGAAIMEDGLSARQAGQVIGLSVAEVCPRHAGLVLRFSEAVNGVPA